MHRLVSIFSLLLLSLSATSQKIVFRDEYNTKNIAMPTTHSVTAGTARVITDPVTNEKLLVFCGKKEQVFYMLDAKWKLIEKFDTKSSDESPFKDEDYIVVDSRHDKKKWDLLLKTDDKYVIQTIDFSTTSVTDKGNTLGDVKTAYDEVFFMENGKARVLYVDKSDNIIVTGFSDNFKPEKVKLDFTTQLPFSDAKKYTPPALFNFITGMDEYTAKDVFTTSSYLHFYRGDNIYTFLATDNEPLAELSNYDPKSGKRISQHLYSVNDLVPAQAKDKKFSSAALLFEKNVHLMIAYKDGGIYAVFDTGTKKRVYEYVFTEKDEQTKFNFGPVEYETLPGVMNYSKVREKVDDISVKKYLEALNKYSFGLTARKAADGSIFIAASSYYFREVAASTAHLRRGINTMTSDAWYSSASAGFILPAGGVSPGANKMPWGQAMGSDASGKYQRVVAQGNAEYNEKGTIIMHSQIIDNKQYVIYYKDREIRIYERK